MHTTGYSSLKYSASKHGLNVEISGEKSRGENWAVKSEDKTRNYSGWNEILENNDMRCTIKENKDVLK
jgi:hypothetical protein